MKKIIFSLVFVGMVFGFVAPVVAQMDEKFYHPSKDWSEPLGLQYEEIVFTAAEDTLYSWLVKPQDDVKATVLYFHGNQANISQWVHYLLPLVNSGYQVAMLDYRGYGKSTGTPTHVNIAADAFRWFDLITTREDVKSTPLILYGASIGTQVTSLLAKEKEEQITAVILDGAMASFTDVALATTPVEYHEHVKNYVVSPYSVKANLPLLTDVSVLFIHSEADFIPIADIRKVYDETSCRKLFWEYEGAHVQAPALYPETFVEYVDLLLPYTLNNRTGKDGMFK